MRRKAEAWRSARLLQRVYDANEQRIALLETAVLALTAELQHQEPIQHKHKPAAAAAANATPRTGVTRLRNGGDRDAPFEGAVVASSMGVFRAAGGTDVPLASVSSLPQ